MSAADGEPGGDDARLAALRREASGAYDAISAADDALRGLAGRRVAAERSLRARLADAGPDHTGPGHAARAAEAQVTEAQGAVTAIQAEFAATVRARAAAVAALRRLTSECAAAQEAIARGVHRHADGAGKDHR